MERKEIFDSIRDFFELLQVEDSDEAKNIQSLIFVLDKLAFAYHFASCEFDEDASELPPHDYQAVRKLVDAKFPSLGFYSEVDPLEIENPTLMIGDAIDDITDIACDLQDVLWCLENTNEDNALWHFQFGYEDHWGSHLRYLQTYLYELGS